MIINILLKVEWNRNFINLFQMNESFEVAISAVNLISSRNQRIIIIFMNIFLVFLSDKSTSPNVFACVECLVRHSRSLHLSLSMCPKHVNLVRCHFSYFIFILSNAVSITFNFCSPHFWAEIPHFYRTHIQINCHLKLKICGEVFQRMNFVSISSPFFDFPVFFLRFYFFYIALSTLRS